MIYLYHGTDEVVGPIDPRRGRRGTDFGQGFYLTPSFDSAKRMALRTARWKGVQRGVVLRYAVDESERAFSSLKRRRDAEEVAVRTIPDCTIFFPYAAGGCLP